VSKARPQERLAEGAIRVLALSSVAAILLVLLFVAREALLRGEVSWGRMLWPQRWPGYEEATWVWQPVGTPPKYSLIPLLHGALRITGMALLLGAPLAFMAAFHVAFVAPASQRRWLKLAVELLAGVPSVLMGLVVGLGAPAVALRLGWTYPMNALVASVALALAVAPVMFTMAEDALTAVPRELKEASLALGARPWQFALTVAAPTAAPGLFAALVLGAGRAIGETMIVLMVSGNAPVLSLDPTASARTITATIAGELGEVEQGGEHWRVLFSLGLLLLLISLALDALGQRLRTRLRRRVEGGT
jgi:phosphate transport system permease protein